MTVRALRLVLILVATGLDAGICSAQVENVGIYELVVQESKTFHLQQDIFADRPVLFVDSPLHWYTSRREFPRWTYGEAFPDTLLSHLALSGAIDSTCTPSQNEWAGCPRSEDYLLIAASVLAPSDDGTTRCQVLVLAPYRTYEGRLRGYFMLAEYKVGRVDGELQILDKEVILIT
jgi:hypothetical protein